MNIGDEVYYKKVDGTYTKAKIVEAKYSPTWEYVVEIPEHGTRKVNNDKIVPASVYNSPLWKALYERSKHHE